MAYSRERNLNVEKFRGAAGLGLSEAHGWIELAGKRRLVTLVASSSAQKSHRRLWTVTAYHQPPGHKGKPYSYTAHLPDSIRVECADHALVGLALLLLELDADKAHTELQTALTRQLKRKA